MSRTRTIAAAAAAALLCLVLAAAGRGAFGRRAPHAAEPAVLAIAAASDLRFVLDEMAAAFEEEHPEVDLAISYGSSGNFYAQLLNGAPFDLFLSADITYPRQLAERGLTVAGSEFQYARGRIVVWVPATSRLDVERRGLDVLSDPAGSRIALANPAHAPYGRAAVAALQHAGLWDQVQPRVVLGENIAQTLQFVQSGSAAAGIVALSLARAAGAAAEGRYWLIPDNMHPPIEQGGAILSSSPHVAQARAFCGFLTGKRGRELLTRYGLAIAGGAQAAPAGSF